MQMGLQQGMSFAAAAAADVLEDADDVPPQEGAEDGDDGEGDVLLCVVVRAGKVAARRAADHLYEVGSRK